MILQVLKYEPEWSVTYEVVLVYLKESYAMMIVNLKYIALYYSPVYVFYLILSLDVMEKKLPFLKGKKETYLMLWTLSSLTLKNK